MGMVITESVLDIIVIDAPVLKSPPYAAGYTMVFIPKGVAKHISARERMVSFIPISFKTITNTAGMITSLESAT